MSADHIATVRAVLDYASVEADGSLAALDALAADLEQAERERDDWRRKTGRHANWQIEAEERAETAEARVEQLEAETTALRALVTEAYDEWGDEGYPTNSWRIKAERLGAWPLIAPNSRGEE